MLTIVKKNDSYDAITYQLENEDNSTVDLTGASVNFVMGKKNKLITNAKATVTSATSGIVSYQLTPSDTLVSGTFLAEFVVTFANGTTKTYPSNGYITVDVEQNLDTSQNNVVLDMIATKQGDFEAKLDSILKQGTGTQISAMNEYTWTATLGQTIFVFPTNAKYDPSSKWFQVSVGNVPIDNELINRASSSQFSLVVDPSLIVAGMTVHAMWVEPIVPITGGHHSTHEINGQDEINIANLRNYQELVATPIASNTTALADRATHDITGDYINVLSPPAPYLPLQIGMISAYKDSNSTRLQALLDGLSTLKVRKLFFPFGVYYFSTGVTINTTRVQLIGVYNDIDTRHGTQLVYFGNGDFITMGTPILQSQYGDNLYNGIQFLSIKNLLIEHGATDTPLNNVSSTWGNLYKAGSRGVVDWCGGSITFDNVTIQHFEYGAYLIQSDFNHFTDPVFYYNHVGVYISSRSDQNIWIRPDFSLNDTGLWVDGALNLSLYSANFVTNGSGSSYGDSPPIKITKGSVNMYAPWIESYNLRSGETLTSIARVGVDSDGWNGILNLCTLKVTEPQVTSGVNYLFKFNNANIYMEGIQEVTTGLTALALKTGSSTGGFFYSFGNNTWDYVNKIMVTEAGASNGYSNGIAASFNQLHLRGQRLYLHHPTDATMDYYIGASASQKMTVQVGGRNLFNNIGLMVEEGSGVPTSGAYSTGDYRKNTVPSEQGTTGSKYLIKGWVCTSSGTACGTAWTQTTSYTVGQQRYNGTHVYQCATAGTSGTGGPTGAGNNITDGTVVWNYVSELAVFLQDRGLTGN